MLFWRWKEAWFSVLACIAQKNLKNIVGNHDSYGNQNFKAEIVIFTKVWVLKNIEIKPTENNHF